MRSTEFWLGPAPCCVRSADQPWSGASQQLRKPCCSSSCAAGAEPPALPRPCFRPGRPWLRAWRRQRLSPTSTSARRFRWGSPGLACRKLLLSQADRVWAQCSSRSSCGACRQAARADACDTHTPACRWSAAGCCRAAGTPPGGCHLVAQLILAGPCRPSRRPAPHSACPQHLQSSPPPFSSSLHPPCTAPLRPPAPPPPSPPSGGPACGASAAAAQRPSTGRRQAHLPALLH